MESKTATKQDAYKPRWKHFHPQSTVWVKNPFDHDVEFQVADEYDRPIKYVMPKGKVSELPGGAVATLGVKRIVDELIQNSPTDKGRMWDENVRTKFENGDAEAGVEGIIIREKQAPNKSIPSTPDGAVDLSVEDNKNKTEEESTEKPPEPEEEFPGVKQGVKQEAQATVANLPETAEIEDDE